jgi:hypothetical protein
MAWRWRDLLWDFTYLCWNLTVSPVSATYEEFIQKTMAFVSQDRTLADAKAAMGQLPGCQDVIVTKSVNNTEPVLGWLSNVDIARFSMA